VTQASGAYEAAPIQIIKEVNVKNYQAIMLMISSTKNKWRNKAEGASKRKIKKAKKKKNRKKENSKTTRRAKIVLYKCNSRLIKSKVH